MLSHLCYPASSFYIPWESAVFGKIVFNDHQSVPYDYFLAIPLLPCRRSDRGMVKFTGSDGPGDPPTTSTAQAVHAFAHFSYVYSGKHILFTDLQGRAKYISLFTNRTDTREGIFDPSMKAYCLFDFQCHRYPNFLSPSPLSLIT
jgi:hypothetical protein